MIVAIDGPAGSGKSTTARAVADALGFLYLDTGAMYRAVALAFHRAGAEPTDAGAADVLPGLEIGMRHDPSRGLRLLLDGEDVSDALRTPEVSRLASKVSALGAVRRKLVDEQRRLARAWEARGSGVVLEGRDIGTVVFPEAEVKVFMKANDVVRARRRQAQLAEKGEEVDVEVLLAEMRERDARDAGRALAPLRKADDAVDLDTTDVSFEEQVDLILQLVRERRGASAV